MKAFEVSFIVHFGYRSLFLYLNLLLGVPGHFNALLSLFIAYPEPVEDLSVGPWRLNYSIDVRHLLLIGGRRSLVLLRRTF